MAQTNLPDLFLFKNGERVTDTQTWQQRREELLNEILDIEYGALPPTPGRVYGELLSEADQHPRQYRVVCEGGTAPFSFTLNVAIPAGEGPFPVVLNGDGCWRYVTEEVTKEVLEHGYILATFDRTEIVPDELVADRDRALYSIYSEGEYGALAAWAWGYHRCVDVISSLPEVKVEQIAIVGHSRGGKAVLLAGATDERIALTAPNNSGCGGAGSFHIEAEGCEKLVNILGMFPYWFSPNLLPYINRDAELPFDHHALKAAVAPRALLSTEALGDLWANPYGTYQTHLAACDVYALFDAPAQIGIWYREGQHEHSLDDWKALLNFADSIFQGKTLGEEYNKDPF